MKIYTHKLNISVAYSINQLKNYTQRSPQTHHK